MKNKENCLLKSFNECVNEVLFTLPNCVFNQLSDKREIVV